MTDCPPQIDLGRLEVEELPPERARALEEHLRSCESCRQAQADLRENLERYAPLQEAHLSQLVTRIRQGSGPVTPVLRARSQRSRAVLWISSTLAATAAVGALILLQPSDQPRTDEPTQHKGTVSLRVFIQRGAHQFKGHPDRPLHAGDVMRFSVTAAAAGYLIVFTVDAAGTISPLHPAPESGPDAQPIEVEQPGDLLLPGSAVLDAAPSHETVVVVFAAQPFHVRPTTQSAVEQLGPAPQGAQAFTLALPQGASANVVSMTFNKRSATP